jgi:peptidoglycan hydrolase CwlO-like protein
MGQWSNANSRVTVWDRLGLGDGKVVRTRSVDADYEEVEAGISEKAVKENDKQLRTQARNLVQKRRGLTEKLNKLETSGGKDKRAIASTKKEIKGLDSRIAYLMSQVS